MSLESLAALAKLLLYMGALVAAGTALAQASLRGELGEAPASAPRRIAAGAFLAIVSALAGGGLLVLRLGGELDGPTLAAIFGGPVGVALGAQTVGGALLLAPARGAARQPLRLAGALLLLVSFGVTGHSASVSAWTGLLAVAHLVTAAWWLGGLLFLRQACRSSAAGSLAALVSRFSRLALLRAGILVASGAVLVYVLVGPSWEAWRAPYAKNLAIKIALAAGALAVASFNRLRLVPRLCEGHPGTPRSLRRAVTCEIAFLLAALAATAWLTTFFSPHDGH